ncbi:hypothetical protein J6590_049259 [Homalodisca vitripennis]|nr:hypothetical protein J6590_049259 [Homalodisca vitripennis]
MTPARTVNACKPLIADVGCLLRLRLRMTAQHIVNNINTASRYNNRSCQRSGSDCKVLKVTRGMSYPDGFLRDKL